MPFEGGAFQYSQTILEAVSALPRDRFDVLVAFTNDSWNRLLKNYELQVLQVSLGIWKFFPGKRLSGYLPMTIWRGTCPYFHSPARILRAQQCDLWIFPAQDIHSYLLPLPALSTIHDLMHRYEPHFPEVTAKGEYDKRERHYRTMCRWAKGIVVDSEIGRKQVSESYNIKPQVIHVLPFVAPANSLRASASCLSDEIRYLPRKFILYPAQFWQHKNHRILIIALALLRKKIPDLHLVFTGTQKNGYSLLQSLIYNLNVKQNITFSGYVSDQDMTGIYRRARAMMMPTFFGPTNIPPLEAMAHGCPTAVSDVYGMRDQLGHAALYFNPHSAQDVARIMEQLWCDDSLCEEMSHRGFLHHSQWNQKHFNERLLHILGKIFPHVNL